MGIDLSDDFGKTNFRNKKFEEPQPFWKLFLRFLFSHVGLVILVGGYAVAGAYIFIALELPMENYRYEVKKTKAEDVEDSIKFLADHFDYYYHQNLTTDEWKKKVRSDLGRLKNYIVDMVYDYNYDGEIDGWNYWWTLPKSLLFTISIMTTIGYGHIVPKTFNGQIFVIIYAIVGVPLMLLFLANIGDAMATWLKYTYSRLCCRWCRSRRKESELPPGVPKNTKGYRLMDEEIGDESYMPTDEVTVPIVLNLVILAIYIVIGGVLFSHFEGWSVSEASYFTFVTIGTIGFGDFVPGNSFLDYKDGFQSALKMIITVMYCVVGLALVSMAINLIQEQVVKKVRWVAKEVGITTSDTEPRIPLEYLRLQAKKQNAEIMQTPDDKIGKAVKPRSGVKREKPRKSSNASTTSSLADIGTHKNDTAKRVQSARSSVNSRPGSAASTYTHKG